MLWKKEKLESRRVVCNFNYGDGAELIEKVGLGQILEGGKGVSQDGSPAGKRHWSYGLVCSNNSLTSSKNSKQTFHMLSHYALMHQLLLLAFH